MRETINVMCLDVAFAHVGVAVVGYPVAGGAPMIRHTHTITTTKSDKKLAVRSANDSVRRCQEAFTALMDTAKAYSVVGLIAELPTGGSKSSAAARAMGMGAAVAACFSETLDLPTEWTTPEMGKVALSGHKNASKVEMKENAAKLWPASTKGFHFKRKSSRSKNKEPEWDDNYEHVADALGAFMAAKGGFVERTAMMLCKERG